MGLQRFDQLLANQKQKELPAEPASNNVYTDVLNSEINSQFNDSRELKQKCQDPEQSEEEAPANDVYNVAPSKELKEEQYNQSKPLEQASASSPLKDEQKLP
jgi:hypothetical protein